MLFWSRLGNCSGFELKWSSRLGVDSTYPGVDSPKSGADLALLESTHPKESIDVFFNLAHSSRLVNSGSRLGAQSPNSLSSVFWLVQSWSRLELFRSRLGSQYSKNSLLSFWSRAALESTRTFLESTRVSETQILSTVFLRSRCLGVDSAFAGVDSALSVRKLLSDFCLVLH